MFLNKVDLFKDKILNSDRHLRLYFTHFTGKERKSVPYYLFLFADDVFSTLNSFSLFSGADRDVEGAADFVQKEFLERNLNKGKIIYPHFTTATDTSNIRVRKRSCPSDRCYYAFWHY